MDLLIKQLLKVGQIIIIQAIIIILLLIIIKLTLQLSLQITEKLSPYLRLSFGKVEGKIFRDSDDNNILKAKGISESIDLGFHLIYNLKK